MAIDNKYYTVGTCPPRVITKILPQVYDDSLSYYQVLCRLGAKIDELIDLVNSYEDAYKDYTDSAVAGLKQTLETELAIINSTLNAKIDNNDTLLIALIEQVQTDITNAYTALINENINAISLRLTQEVITLNARITREVAELKEYIDSSIIDLQVVNPFTGEIQGIQVVLNTMADYIKTDALTASEYDALQLTAIGYDNYQLTAYMYDFKGKLLLQ